MKLIGAHKTEGLDVKIDRTDKQLLNQLKAGNIIAFNTVFEMYSSKLFLFANGYLKSVDESEEIVQEVFATIWRKRDQLRSDLSFKAYIFTIAYNIIKKQFRKRTQFRNFLNAEVFEERSQETANTINYNSLKKFVWEVVHTLPEKRREVFIKSRFEELTNIEIAEELKISKKTVENHLNLALREIKSKIVNESISSMLYFYLFFSNDQK